MMHQNKTIFPFSTCLVSIFEREKIALMHGNKTNPDLPKLDCWLAWKTVGWVGVKIIKRQANTFLKETM